MKLVQYSLFLFSFTSFVFSQTLVQQEPDPCGYPDSSMMSKFVASIGFGYGYDTLKIDLDNWSKSPFVKIDSIGATFQNRTMFMLTIEDTSKVDSSRKRIWIHARTHPIEVQGTWVTNEIIKILLSDSSIAKTLRDSCVFNIVPMYNPDGVELGKLRENANNIDIEGNWNTFPSQPEVNVLRNMFTTLMSKPNQIKIALNMHSAYPDKNGIPHRYFVYHTATGTSTSYSAHEIKFIDTVRCRFQGGIEPYTFFQSWTSSAAKQYPESWFWYNHKENVLALTYEDMNDPSANSFTKTAFAILNGIADDLGITKSVMYVAENNTVPSSFVLEQNFPNPFNPSTVIQYQIPINLPLQGGNSSKTKGGFVTLKVFDVIGREVATLVNETQSAGLHSVQFDGRNLSSGVYYYVLRSGEFVSAKKMVLLK